MALPVHHPSVRIEPDLCRSIFYEKINIDCDPIILHVTYAVHNRRCPTVVRLFVWGGGVERKRRVLFAKHLHGVVRRLGGATIDEANDDCTGTIARLLRYWLGVKKFRERTGVLTVRVTYCYGRLGNNPWARDPCTTSVQYTCFRPSNVLHNRTQRSLGTRQQSRADRKCLRRTTEPV